MGSGSYDILESGERTLTKADLGGSSIPYPYLCDKQPSGTMLFLLVSIQRQDLTGGWVDAQSGMRQC